MANTTLSVMGLFGGAVLIYAGWTRKSVLSVFTGIAGAHEPHPSAFHNVDVNPGGGLSASGNVSPTGSTPNGGAIQGKGIFTRANLGRVDEGVDFKGAGPIPAVGSGTIVDTAGHGWPGGTFILEKLDSPIGGHQLVYYAENIAPQVHAGQRVAAGQSVGMARGSYPYTEEGWAAGPGQALAHGHYREGQKTQEGYDFLHTFFPGWPAL